MSMPIIQAVQLVNGLEEELAETPSSDKRKQAALKSLIRTFNNYIADCDD